MSELNSYTSKAWLLDGPIHSCPGVLRLDAGQLSYLIIESGTFSDKGIRKRLERFGQSEDGELAYPIELFSVAVADITRFHVPWYYFGAGGKLAFGESSARFSFVRPQNTVEPSYFSEATMQWMGGAGQEEVNLAEGRRIGKTWKTLLAT